MVPSNVLTRTLHMRYGKNPATCFTIEVDDRQYIVTARHLVRHINDTDVVEIYHNGEWKSLTVKKVGSWTGEADVAVLAADVLITPILPLMPGAGEIILSQDVYFLGFPYGWRMDTFIQNNNNYPLPFVKKAIVSAFIGSGSEQQILLDGHNNPGFSGGPVFFIRAGTKEEFMIGAIVSGFKFKRLPILDGTDKTQYEYEYNTGIIVTYSITAALDLIANSPIGCETS